MNESAVMRVRHAKPAVNPTSRALANEARPCNRSSAQAVRTNAAANVSSRHPSTLQVIELYSIAIRNAAANPPAREMSAAPSR